MKILELEIQNNKAIRAFIKSLNGNNLEIAGEPGTGKTTAISALWEIMEKCPDALTKGEKSGQIKIKCGAEDKWLIAERRHTAKTSTVTIFDQDGKKVSVKDFKTMLSGLAVNPHKIMEMKPTEQTATLLKAASVETDLDALDAEISKAEQERLYAYRNAESKKPGPKPEKTEKVSVGELLKELERRQAINSQNDEKRQELLNTEELIETSDHEIVRIKKQIELLNAELFEEEAVKREHKKRYGVLKKETDNLEYEETESIKLKINDAEKTNEKAAEFQSWFVAVSNYKAALREHEAIHATIKELRTKKKSALDSAKWPLDGLSIQDGNIVYNDILLQNLGTSEQMLVTAALAIEDIKRHPLKVVRMDGIESMGKSDYEKLKKLFNKHGIQVLATRVSRGETEPYEIVITEGKYGI
jgi:hypothetical protein